MRSFLPTVLAFVVLPAFALSAAASDACSVPRFRIYEGQTAPATMTVQSGKPCSIRLRNSMGGITEARLLTKPAAGSAVILGTSVTYTAKAGFTGSDRFLWAWVGKDRFGRDGTWPIEVSVTVIP
jgi:hypothetical protein